MKNQKKLIIIIWLLNLFFIVLLWWNNNGNLLTKDLVNNLLAWARLAGLLAVYFVLTQLLLIGRLRWLEPYFGHDRLSKSHHYFGLISFVLMTLHFIFLIVSFGQLAHLDWWQQVLDFINNWEEVPSAIISWLLFLITIISSLVIVFYKWRYEFWYYLHLLTYAAIIMAFGHQLEWGGDLQQGIFVRYWWFLYLLVGVNYVYYRFIKIIINHQRHHFKVAKVIAENDLIYSIYLQGDQLTKFKYYGGQFVIVRFLTSGFWSEAHPFSFSQEPNDQYLRLTIKASGDFTKKLKDIPINTTVLVDGAHGVFVPVKNKKTLLIAGGIGITPFRAMLPSLIKQEPSTILIVSNKKKSDSIFSNELISYIQNNNFQLINLLTQEESQLNNRLDLKMIQNLVPDWQEREIYLCGPKKMIIDLMEQMRQVGINKKQLHYELFSW